MLDKQLVPGRLRASCLDQNAWLLAAKVLCNFFRALHVEPVARLAIAACLDGKVAVAYSF
jgi:hypothetical protein